MAIIPRDKEHAKEIIRTELKEYGVHIVAAWDDGGSDAVDLAWHTPERLIEAYPEIKMEDAIAFYNADIDELKSDPYEDDLGRKVVDTIYHPVYHENDGTILTIREECDDEPIEETDDDIPFPEVTTEINLTRRLETMPIKELETFVNEIKFPLSGLGIGTADAWALMADIEAIAIEIYQARSKNDN